MIRTAKLLEIWQEERWYYFKFTADGEDLYRVESILRSVPRARRTFDPKSNTWGLRVGPDSERLLTETFINGGHCVDLMKAQ